ncbi:Divalent metal cation transporter MntH [Symmachiella dynata]|uniref:Nramp family divalent metal transporter n=1 Tax=Symmachiella dynata TaxID=2527995 RepID=UPI00118B7DAE|nr:Nramp family divalent metal transporter [Symmachiella dynata]QDT50300.1 Divalent metal cation transporter MntH [Symmachiella dynata]
MNEPRPAASGFLSIFRAVGPAIIVASVVVGPGSILTSSRIGVEFGYSMIWVLAIAVLLMMGMTALSARLGVVLEGTLCDELARRAGRPVAALAGISLFLIAACFQFGNNLGVLAAIEPFVESADATVAADAGFFAKLTTWPNLLVIGLNAVIICVLLGFQNLYKPVEKMMMFLVGLMFVGFAANLILAAPSPADIARGLIPSLPAPKEGVDMMTRFAPLIGLFATTFSVAGAFYQSYLVRKKGWTTDNLRQGAIDSSVGIAVLGTITLMIMLTAASVLHGKMAGSDLKSATDVALQLEPLFGEHAFLAKSLFCMGLFSAAFSSFMVNAMIGGSMLSDGLGFGGDMDAKGPKVGTILALLTGMIVAVAIKAFDFNTVNLIIFAQAMVVVGFPILAGAMLWLATRPDLTGQRAVPLWLKGVAAVGLLITLGLAVRTSLSVYEKIAAM